MSPFFRKFSSPGGNELISLQNEDLKPDKHPQSILSRISFRSGMLIYAQGLSAPVYLPNGEIKSQKSGGTKTRDLAVGTKPENFTLPDLRSAQQSLDKLKGENGAVSVWVSAQKF